MASITEEIEKGKKKLEEIKKQIRELKEIRSKTSLNFFQKSELSDLDEAQNKLISHIKKLHASL